MQVLVKSSFFLRYHGKKKSTAVRNQKAPHMVSGHVLYLLKPVLCNTLALHILISWLNVEDDEPAMSVY